MIAPLDDVARAVLVGCGATATIDVWAALLRRSGVPSLSMAWLGRWVGHLAQGRWRHQTITGAAPIRGESWLGWAAHYGIGITFAALLLALGGPDWARSPTWPLALGVGVGTVVAPWFILQPGMGAGIASSRTARPVFNAVKSLATHVVFGLGLYLAARLTAVLLPVGGWD